MEIKTSSSFAVCTHEGAILHFSWKYYHNSGTNYFTPFNAYIESLDKNTQDSLFNAFKDIYNIFYQYKKYDHRLIVDNLTDAVRQFYSIIDFDHLRRWSERYHHRFMPSELRSEYGSYDPKTTYLRSDYIGLLFLSTLLKPMLLVWGEFLSRYKSEFGTLHKELAALPLISRSGITETVEYQKLRDYVYAITVGSTGTLNTTLNGLGTSTLSDWGMATLVLRRVAAGNTDDPSVSMVGRIHSYLDNGINKPARLESIDSKKRYYERTPPPGKSQRDDDRNSVIDNHRLRQAQPDHVVIVAESFVRNIQNVFDAIDPTIGNLENTLYAPLLNDRIYNMYPNIEINSYQIRLIILLVADSIGAKNIPCMQYNVILRLVLITQAVLHHWGLHGLAHLMTADSSEIYCDDYVDSSIKPVPTDMQERLAALYKHQVFKNKSETRRPRPLVNNVGMIFIQNIMEDIRSYNLKYNSPVYLFKQNELNKQNTHLEIPVDIRTELAQVLLKTRS